MCQSSWFALSAIAEGDARWVQKSEPRSRIGLQSQYCVMFAECVNSSTYWLVPPKNMKLSVDSWRNMRTERSSNKEAIWIRGARGIIFKGEEVWNITRLRLRTHEISRENQHPKKKITHTHTPHTHTHTHTHTHRHTQHTHTHTDTHTHKRTHKRTHTHTQARTHTHTHAHTNFSSLCPSPFSTVEYFLFLLRIPLFQILEGTLCSRKHTDTPHSHTHAHTHTHTHTHTRTHTHTHTHTQTQAHKHAHTDAHARTHTRTHITTESLSKKRSLICNLRKPAPGHFHNILSLGSRVVSPQTAKQKHLSARLKSRTKNVGGKRKAKTTTCNVRQTSHIVVATKNVARYSCSVEHRTTFRVWAPCLTKPSEVFKERRTKKNVLHLNNK